MRFCIQKETVSPWKTRMFEPGIKYKLLSRAAYTPNKPYENDTAIKCIYSEKCIRQLPEACKTKFAPWTSRTDCKSLQLFSEASLN